MHYTLHEMAGWVASLDPCELEILDQLTEGELGISGTYLSRHCPRFHQRRCELMLMLCHQGIHIEDFERLIEEAEQEGEPVAWRLAA